METPSSTPPPPETTFGNQYNYDFGLSTQFSRLSFLNTNIGVLFGSDVEKYRQLVIKIGKLTSDMELTAAEHRKLIIECFRKDIEPEEARNNLLKRKRTNQQ